MSSPASKGDVQKKKRRPHTRVSKACTFCRQQKTRCLRSGISVSCLRCISLDLTCSLLQDSEISKSTVPPTSFGLISSPPATNQLKSLSKTSGSTPPPTNTNTSTHSHSNSITQHTYEMSPSLLPSIPNSISSVLFDRFNPSPSQFQQKLHDSPLNPPQHQLHDIIPQLANISPRLSQSHVPPSPLPSFTADIDSSNKIDAIQNDVKQILNIISSNGLGNQHSSIPLNSKISESSSVILEPVNTTNIPTQYHLLSPINYMKLLTNSEFNEPTINSSVHRNNNNSNNNENIVNNNIESVLQNNNLTDNKKKHDATNLPFCLQQQLYPLHAFRPPYQDIVSTKILTIKQTIHLLNIFRDRYGRWLSFPSLKSTKKLLKRLRMRCPLLLTVSCLLSLKYGDPLLKQRVWKQLQEIVRKEVHWLSSTYSGGLEELQCLVILAAYSVGLSDFEVEAGESFNSNKDQPPLLLDGWHLTGVGLTLFEKINGFGILDQMYGDDLEILWKNNKNKILSTLGISSTVDSYLSNSGKPSIQNNHIDGGDDDDDVDEEEEEEEEEDEDDEFNLLTLHRIWNHLTLIQLAYCLLYGRKSWISSDRLQPRDVSDISNATNFDFRIVAEIQIYLIGYRYMVLNEIPDNTRNNVKMWLNKWNCTFGQPSNQFVEVDYHFVEILIKIKQLKLDLGSLEFSQGTVNSNSKDLIDLKIHAHAIVNLIETVNDDSYFAFLSDQIHLTVFYATNVLISALSQLKRINNQSYSNNDAIDKEVMNKIEKLIFRFRTVATTKDDPFYKYYKILENTYITKLPQAGYQRKSNGL